MAAPRRSPGGCSAGQGWRKGSEFTSISQLDGSDIVYVARVAVPNIVAPRVDVGTDWAA
jgi:IclR family pca regulon transcriptional regulator